MKEEIKNLNDAIEDGGSAVYGLVNAIVPITADVITAGWKVVRGGTEIVAGGIDKVVSGAK